jgi:hypothetical protein
MEKFWGPPSLLSSGYQERFPGTKAPEREADHSPPSSAEVNSAWSYEGVSKSFRTGRLERELQIVQLSATRCSCIAILWVSLVSFTAITLCIASQWVFIVVSIYFVIDSVLKLLDTPSHTSTPPTRLHGVVIG